VKRSTTPFCAAARVLLAEGLDPATKLVMRHEGSTHDVLRSTVGAAAKITVADGSTGKPVFVPWVDLSERHENAARSGPPMRETESPRVSGYPTPQNLPRSPPHERGRRDTCRPPDPARSVPGSRHAHPEAESGSSGWCELVSALRYAAGGFGNAQCPTACELEDPFR
jgi:hypothetical protein